MNIYQNNYQPKSHHHFDRYLRYIDQIKNRTLCVIRTEIHHILPRSMGGTDDKDNLISLSPREHFIAHRLLWRAYRNKQMTNAFWFMSHYKENNLYKFDTSY